jgi:hypothetical protein
MQNDCDISQNFDLRCSSPNTANIIAAAPAVASNCSGCMLQDDYRDMVMHPTCTMFDNADDDVNMLVFENGDNAFLELLALDKDHQATIPASAAPLIPKSVLGASQEAIRGLEEETAVHECGAVVFHDGWTSHGFVSNRRGGSGGAFTELDKVCFLHGALNTGVSCVSVYTKHFPRVKVLVTPSLRF